MKKLNTILMTLILLLSITVRAAPVVNNNNAVAQGDKVEEEHRVKVFLVPGGLMLIALVPVGTAAVLSSIVGKPYRERKAERAKRRKEAKKALRKRAEAEYAYRHASHKQR
jgi:hypothetical protein